MPELNLQDNDNLDLDCVINQEYNEYLYHLGAVGNLKIKKS